MNWALLSEKKACTEVNFNCPELPCRLFFFKKIYTGTYRLVCSFFASQPLNSIKMTFQKEMIDFIYLYNFQYHDYISEKYASSGDKFKKLFKNKLTRALQEKHVVCFNSI